jgi:transcriptional regulator with XRE-family HTH domain
MSDHSVEDSGRLPWLGPRLREAREERGKTIAEVSSAAGISRSYLHELETAKPSARPIPTAAILMRLAQILGTSIGELVEESPQKMAADIVVPPGLREAAREENLSEAEIQRLAAIRFRGEQPQSKERWRLLIQSLALSGGMDDKRRD